jgi:hypothetical protein
MIGIRTIQPLALLKHGVSGSCAYTNFSSSGWGNATLMASGTITANVWLSEALFPIYPYCRCLLNSLR